MASRLIHCSVSSAAIRIIGVFWDASNINFNALIFLRTNSVLPSSQRAWSAIIAIMSVRYLTQNPYSSMVISRCKRLKVGRHQINSANATWHIVR